MSSKQNQFIFSLCAQEGIRVDRYGHRPKEEKRRRRRSINTYLHNFGEFFVRFPISVSGTNIIVTFQFQLRLNKIKITNNNTNTNAQFFPVSVSPCMWVFRNCIWNWLKCSLNLCVCIVLLLLHFRIPICQLIKWTCCDVNCVVWCALISWYDVVILARHYITGWIFILFYFFFCLFIFYKTYFFCIHFKHQQRQRKKNLGNT